MKPINKYLVNRRLTKQDGPKELTEEEVRSYIYEDCNQYCEEVNIYYNGSEPIVDIEGDFYFRNDITEIPFQFGKVTGNFVCSDCKNLTSLKGCPKEVGGTFNCYNCPQLESLEGCPKEVGLNFYCGCCSKKFTEQEVRSLCNVKGNIYIYYIVYR